MPRKRKSSPSKSETDAPTHLQPPLDQSLLSEESSPALEKDALDDVFVDAGNSRPENRCDRLPNSLKTSPNLFPNGRATTHMASALPIWEASNILTQRQHLPWSADPKGTLRYARHVENGTGAVHFWVTEDLEAESPTTLAGAAALAVIDTFDIRAACMHLIYTAHATQIARPWEEEFVISDRQIEEYLGLKRRTDKSKQQKLTLIQEIAKQPCKITTFVSWPNQDKVKGFTIEEGRLWHLLGTRYHYQQDLFGNKELSGVTFVVRAGLWARYFLTKEGRRSKNALCEYGVLSRASLRDVMSVWQHREGAARLMVWLLFKTRTERQTPLRVETLMDVSFGEEYVRVAQRNSKTRKKLVSLWDDTLHVLDERGWCIQFDPDTYPPEIRPMDLGRSKPSRPRGFFEYLLNARVWITPQDDWGDPVTIADPLPDPVEEEAIEPGITGEEVKASRVKRGWSQRKLAALTGLSQGLISQIETGGRSLTPENTAILLQIFSLNPSSQDGPSYDFQSSGL
jgi:DNA-binding XRE family transcriptional regulator